MILRRFDPLSSSLKRVHASMNILFLMNKTKDQISRVSSHDLYWENKMYKRKRSIHIINLVEKNNKPKQDKTKKNYLVILPIDAVVPLEPLSNSPTNKDICSSVTSTWIACYNARACFTIKINMGDQ